MQKNYKKLLLIVSAFIFVFLNATMIQASPLKDTIEVNGRATIKVKPNIAYISATVSTQNKDAKIAQEKNANIIDQLKKDSISKYKLTDTDIITSYYNVNPAYDYVDGKQIFRNYVVEHTLTITAKDVTKVGEIVDTLVTSGATFISNIRFDILDSDVTYNLALQRALENANSKSNAITTMLGVKNAKPISIVEQGGSVGTIEREMSSIKQVAGTGGGINATNIGQGEIEVIASVVVIFQY